MKSLSCFILLWLLSCGHSAASSSHDPGASPSTSPPTSPNPPTSPSPPPPAWASQLSSNCQAPLAFTEEVTRLLNKTAAHATSSGACYDGPGTRVTVGSILVCPGRETKKQLTLHARYDVTSTGEGDTRFCSGQPNGCPWTIPVTVTHYAVFSFTGEKGTYRIQIPLEVPGFAFATPLTEEHNGDCYGKSGPFEPQTVRR